MLEVATRTLQTLRDIQGIQGSFVLSRDSGQLLARDMPNVFDSEALLNVGPRITRLFDVLDLEVPVESSTLRFAEHRLDVRAMGQNVLCVLADASVNQPALRMAIKLVCRKLETMNWSSAVVDEEAPVPTTKSTPPESVTSRRNLIYRGTRIPG